METTLLDVNPKLICKRNLVWIGSKKQSKLINTKYFCTNIIVNYCNYSNMQSALSIFVLGYTTGTGLRTGIPVLARISVPVDKNPYWHFKILVPVNKNRNSDLEIPVPVNKNRISGWIPEITRIWSNDHLKINSKLYCIIEGLKTG